MTSLTVQSTRTLSNFRLNTITLNTAKLQHWLHQPSKKLTFQAMSTSSGSSSDPSHTDNDDPKRPLLKGQNEGERNQQNEQVQGKQGKQAKGQPPKRRDTHFLCFPLTTKAAIPQLVQSLNAFKCATTTVHPRQKLMDQRRQEEEEAETNSRSGQSINVESDPASTAAQTTHSTFSLRIIPSTAHRPPGTFHLTLGTMDLSSPTEMRRAIDLLHSLNLQGLLALASTPSQADHVTNRQSASPTASDSATKRRLSRPNPTRLNDTSGATEMSDNLSRASRLVKDVGHGIREGVEKTVDTLRRSVSPPDTKARRRSRGMSLSSLSNSPPLQRQDGDVAEVGVDSAHREPTVMGGDVVPADERLNGLEAMNMHRPPPLTINLHGLGTFPSAKKARVFYAPPQDASDRLLPFANAIRQRFKDAGFVTEARPLTLHATVANLRYASKARKGRSGRAARARGRDTVDARSLIERFSGADDGRTEQGVEGAAAAVEPQQRDSFVFAKDIVIDRVRICKMGAERSEDEVLGMVYPAIRISGNVEEVEVVAEVVFGEGLEEMAY